MAFPTVIINILNMMRGSIPAVEFHFLYVGYGTVPDGAERNLIIVDNTSNLDDVLSDADASLLRTMQAAQLNGKQSWTAGVMILKEGDDWQDAINKANETSSFEATVLNFPAVDKTLLESAIALRHELKAKLGRETFVICTTPAIDATAVTGQTWADYLADTAAIQDSVASEYITVAPQLHLNNSTVGIYAGRLANQEVSIADSPARVKTGSVLGSTDLAVDMDGKPLQLAYLKALETNRYAVPMWFPDYPGQYWTTGRTLDVPGGDYQDIRHIRVAMKAARKVRIRAIARIADRELNSTPGSIASAKLYFTQDLREMAITKLIGDYEFPGEIYPPEDDDIVITWVNSEEVEILLAVQPYDCPSKITVGIMLNQKTGA
ncbi:DUF2586 domain-containing protein [Psychromonas sp. SR45-3]|uniref:DUF2586 domain-containing protein n=1 Tax=Psychromonas sp. SR45-3 TaxID=2760930 RepID=UPI0015F86961|nr:DUF2586 domain-containing protein [Psychromonas sp. SR45-3]MBB1272532.1 DUF2586 family protein [Psychromonas sp. SR45-3]